MRPQTLSQSFWEKYYPVGTVHSKGLKQILFIASVRDFLWYRRQAPLEVFLGLVYADWFSGEIWTSKENIFVKLTLFKRPLKKQVLKLKSLLLVSAGGHWKGVFWYRKWSEVVDLAIAVATFLDYRSRTVTREFFLAERAHCVKKTTRNFRYREKNDTAEAS